MLYYKKEHQLLSKLSVDYLSLASGKIPWQLLRFTTLGELGCDCSIGRASLGGAKETRDAIEQFMHSTLKALSGYQEHNN